jgi:hypothetical protein
MSPYRAAEPEDGPRAHAGEWRLESTLVSAERRLAVIDGRRYRVGEVVTGGWSVAEILPQQVRLIGPAGAQRILTLVSLKVKSSAADSAGAEPTAFRRQGE